METIYFTYSGIVCCFFTFAFAWTF